MDKLPLSLVIVTRQEDKNIVSNLSRCIRSVPFASDCLVLDSSDSEAQPGVERAVDVARKLGARTLQEPWRGSAKQKTRATALARHDWILALEPAEALSSEAQNEIYTLAKDGQLSADAYRLERRMHYLNRFLLHGGFGGDFQTRLFHRERAKWVESGDEAVLEASNVAKRKAPLLYWPYEGVAAQIETLNAQSTRTAQALANKNETYSRGKMIGEACAKFVRIYFINGAFKDGPEGFFAALFAALSRLFVWSKVYELQLRRKSEPK